MKSWKTLPKRSAPEGRYDGGLAHGTALRIAYTETNDAFLNRYPYVDIAIFIVVIQRVTVCAGHSSFGYKIGLRSNKDHGDSDRRAIG